MRRRVIIGAIVGAVLLVGLLFVPSFPAWTGIQGKTAWDLLSLAVVPLALFLLGVYVNHEQKERELRQAAQERERAERLAKEERENDRRIANDREEEMMLQNYFDRMTELITAHKLKESIANTKSELFILARARTIATLKRLKDIERRNSLLRFIVDAEIPLLKGAVLNEEDLTKAYLPRTSLEGVILNHADLREAYLNNANLQGSILLGVNLEGAYMKRANLQSAYLEEANLKGAFLVRANLTEATLNGANLTNANLRGAILREASLEEADLSGVHYDRETVWPEDFTPPTSAVKHRFKYLPD